MSKIQEIDTEIIRQREVKKGQRSSVQLVPRLYLRLPNDLGGLQKILYSKECRNVEN